MSEFDLFVDPDSEVDVDSPTFDEGPAAHRDAHVSSGSPPSADSGALLDPAALVDTGSPPVEADSRAGVADVDRDVVAADVAADGGADRAYLARVPEPLRAALARRGYDVLTTVQEAVLDACGESRDLRISSQTGSGKTVALGFVAAPALLAAAAESSGAKRRGPTLLVIVPTRELAAQVRSELEWLFADVAAIKLECVTGGTNLWRERERLARGPAVLVGTPGRLLDHLREGALQLGDVRQLILDEADQMLDMGFREDLEAILDATPAERRTHLVSATLPDGILRLAERYQSNPLHVEGTRLGEANADIEHLAFRVRDHERYPALVNLLLADGGDRTLVFVNTRIETTELADKLAADGFSALPLSGELAQTQRNRTLAAFKSGAATILVATDVASRGLDVPDVTTVVHTAPCLDSEIYTHRSGRTGRAGRKGRSLQMVPLKKQGRVRWQLKEAGVQVEWRPLPTATEVAELLDERARAASAAALADAPAPSVERLDEARALLAERDAVEVVAALLERTRPTDEPRPHELDPTPRREDRAGGGRQDRDDGRVYERKELRGPRHAARGGSGQRADGGGEPVSFRINWGFASGANPKRLLAHICRRGRVQGRDVGAIRLDAHASTFEIEADAARDFEGFARERDRRDPHLHIERDADAGRPDRSGDRGTSRGYERRQSGRSFERGPRGDDRGPRAREARGGPRGYGHRSDEGRSGGRPSGGAGGSGSGYGAGGSGYGAGGSGYGAGGSGHGAGGSRPGGYQRGSYQRGGYQQGGYREAGPGGKRRDDGPGPRPRRFVARV